MILWRIFCGIICFIFFLPVALSQSHDFIITDFHENVRDLTAATSAITDLRGMKPALIRFAVRDTSFSFTANNGILSLKKGVGEILLFVPDGTKFITVKHPYLGILRDYALPLSIRSKTTYDAEIVIQKEGRLIENKVEKTITNGEPPTSGARSRDMGYSGPSTHISESVKVYDVVEEMPQFPGGPQALFEYLSKNIKYPVVAEENGVQGRVIVTFIVELDGSVTNPKVVKSVDPSLDKEALRVVKSMPYWIPGRQNGSPVRVKYTVPVTFRLQEINKEVQSSSVQTRQQYTAWFVFGTKDELVRQNILTNDGAFSRTRLLDGAFNRDYFTKIDIRIDKEIKLYSRKARILTSHPSSAYIFKPDVNMQYVLRITDPQLFWSTSKYLVIIVE